MIQGEMKSSAGSSSLRRKRCQRLPGSRWSRKRLLPRPEPPSSSPPSRPDERNARPGARATDRRCPGPTSRSRRVGAYSPSQSGCDCWNRATSSAIFCATSRGRPPGSSACTSPRRSRCSSADRRAADCGDGIGGTIWSTAMRVEPRFELWQLAPGTTGSEAAALIGGRFESGRHHSGRTILRPMYWMKTAASSGCLALVGSRKRLPPAVVAVP